MNVSNYTQMIETGMNNPDCAFFVGSWTGQFISFKYMIAIMVFVAIYKVIGNTTQLLWDKTAKGIKWLRKNK